MDDAICVASNHDDLVGTVVYRGGVTTAFLLGLRAYNERVFVEKWISLHLEIASAVRLDNFSIVLLDAFLLLE